MLIGSMSERLLSPSFPSGLSFFPGYDYITVATTTWQCQVAVLRLGGFCDFQGTGWSFVDTVCHPFKADRGSDNSKVIQS